MSSVRDEFIKTLEKWQQREIKAERADVLQCVHCGNYTYYGGMNLISLAILNDKPSCGCKPSPRAK